MSDELWAAIRACMEEPVEVDIWRAGHLLIHQRGDEAEIFAAQRAELMLDRGDPDGQLDTSKNRVFWAG